MTAFLMIFHADKFDVDFISSCTMIMVFLIIFSFRLKFMLSSPFLGATYRGFYDFWFGGVYIVYFITCELTIEDLRYFRMVIVAGYGHGDTSSNPGPDRFHSTNTLGKGMNPNILPLAMGK